ncbi:uncharacterized protein A1O9_12670 [Exophiala aquamarina CBS 119918]|uniref:Uncharacterized protein n=1 Tax=Exophiala aquamarina CBS 119918 TaxID=1182545 RepID=A0A072P6W8_9EURO|nr:uncharacterized protein A1O9_12670 [Exophiala aquamarina CBS 119918]KEF51320.1 hypothetical protein A1O9_12670 [Exophiala aquamarina CBS 119918]
MAFESFLPASSKRPRSQHRWPSQSAQLLYVIRENFSLSTWLLIGALIQSAIVMVIPRLYAFLPAFLVLAARLVDSLAITYGFKRNHYLDEAIIHRVAPQIPDENGIFSENPSNEKVVVFMLGAKSNHPLGVFAPRFKETGDFLSNMTRALDKNAVENGFFGGSAWTNQDKNGAREFLFISYWRSTEDVHKFAYLPVHREAWDWWNATVAQNDHIGINHEIFEVDRHHWEGVYLNFQPTLLGATTYLKKGDKMIGGTVEDQWISPLIDARKGKLRSSAGRLGHDPQKNAEKYKFDGYGGVQ